MQQRQLYRQVVWRLAGGPGEPVPAEVPAAIDRWAEYLHVMTDGLASQLMVVPDDMPPQHARAVLRDFLREIPRVG